MTIQSKPRDIVQIGAMTLRFVADTPSIVDFEFTVPPKASVPGPRHHRDVDEVVYGLGGTLSVAIDSETHRIGAGESCFIPRGSVHFHDNPGDETARALVVLRPGSIGHRYFEEVAAKVNGPGAPDPTKIGNIMPRHGLIPAAPRGGSGIEPFPHRGVFK